VADAAYLAFQKPARPFSGKFLIDDAFLAAEGIRDFVVPDDTNQTQYLVANGAVVQ
jgi:hypothetical protein